MNSKWHAWILSTFVAVQAGVAGLAGFVVLGNQPSDTLPGQVTMGGLSLGGLTADDAVTLVLSQPEAAGAPAVLSLALPQAPTQEGRATRPEDDPLRYPISAQALSLAPSEALLRQQLGELATESVWQRMLSRFSDSAGNNPAPLPLPLSFHEDAVRDAVSAVASVWNQAAEPAAVTLQGEGLLVEPESWGRRLAEDRLFLWLTNRLSSGIDPDGEPAGNGVVTLQPTTEDPAICEFEAPSPTMDLFNGMRKAGSADVLLSESGERDAAAAAAVLTNRLLLSRETVSVKAWLEEGGFVPQTLDASSRVATAVFRTLLPIEGVTVSQRRASPYATNYAPPGQEAVMTEPADDLVLSNDSTRPILLMARAEGASLRVFAFSDIQGVAGLLFSDVTETTEPPLIQSPTRELAPGDVRVLAPGRAGIQVSVYRVDEQGKTLLHTDAYPPQNRVIEVGMPPDPRLMK